LDQDLSVVPCPADLESFEPLCETGKYTARIASACDGVIVEVGALAHVQQLFFDESGTLVGSRLTGDVGDTACWGESCQAAGTRELVCANGSGGAGGSSD
jgi:hypothetical protein